MQMRTQYLCIGSLWGPPHLAGGTGAHINTHGSTVLGAVVEERSSATGPLMVSDLVPRS